MDNTETLHNKTMVVAENDGFRFEAVLFKSIQKILGSGCHGPQSSDYYKRTIVAETVGIRFEADLFKSAPMIFGFGCHGQH